MKRVIKNKPIKSLWETFSLKRDGPTIPWGRGWTPDTVHGLCISPNFPLDQI